MGDPGGHVDPRTFGAGFLEADSEWGRFCCIFVGLVLDEFAGNRVVGADKSKFARGGYWGYADVDGLLVFSGFAGKRILVGNESNAARGG